MALVSYVQRRHSGIYEFSTSDLINSSTGKFEHESIQSLDTRGCRQGASPSDRAEARHGG
jgi:hypothetical protein